MPQLGWTARPDGFIDYYNRGWYEYTGTTYEQMEGWGWQSVHDPRHLPQVVREWKRIIEAGEPGELLFPLRRWDGAFRWFLTRVHPFRDETGTLVRWVGSTPMRTRDMRLTSCSAAGHDATMNLHGAGGRAAATNSYARRVSTAIHCSIGHA